MSLLADKHVPVPAEEESNVERGPGTRRTFESRSVGNAERETDAGVRPGMDHRRLQTAKCLR